MICADCQFSDNLRALDYASDHVTILMATFNGAAFLQAQLDSFQAQSHRNWSLLVSDDGSRDETLTILRAFQNENPERRIQVLKGPQQGFAQNFLSLLRAAGQTPYAAFADQDDVWLPQKLQRAIYSLSDTPGPMLYGGRSVIVDADLNEIGRSPIFRRPPSLSNALVQNIAGGNTMMLNRAALDILQPASLRANRIVAHDWWTYQMVMAIGGAVVLDSVPTVLYRQHANNCVGSNITWADRLRRFTTLWSGEFRGWREAQLDALEGVSDRLSEDAIRVIFASRDLSATNATRRARALRATGVRRQTFVDNAALWISTLAGRA